MSNVNRIRWGVGAPVPAPVDSAVGIEIGDFVCLASNKAIPASSVADAGLAVDNREAAADAFIGIAISAHLANSGDGEILVVQEGVFMLNQETAASIGFGDLVEIYATDTAAADQLIVAGSTSPIAACVKTHDDTTTETLCKLLPGTIFGTPNA